LEAVEELSNGLARQLGVPVQPGKAYATINGLDGFEQVESDGADFQRAQAQVTGHFLLDRDGVVRWARIERAWDAVAGFDRFPTDEELMAAARAL
jgi:hypothetical protein